VSEGVVGLVEPFIDTIVIVTMTALVIIITGSWNDRVQTEISITGGDRSYITVNAAGNPSAATAPEELRIENGLQMVGPDGVRFAWHDVPVESFYTDQAQTQSFTGVIRGGKAIADDGTTYTTLYGDAPEGGAPLTMMAFRRGLAPVGDWGHYIVLISVLLFGISTAIAWSYYGDRCATYLFGAKAVLPYKFAYVAMHFFGAIIAPAVAWDLGDIFLGIVILPNLIALVWLSGKTKEMMDSYFERKPWLDNLAVHQRLKDEGKPLH